MSLADFVAWYNSTKQSSKPIQKPQTSDGLLPEDDFEDNFDDDLEEAEDLNCSQEQYGIKGGFKIVKRAVPKVIRSVRYNKSKNSENYYQEQLMLYIPWRNEDKDLICDCKTFEEKYEQVKDVILKSRCQYEFHSDVLDKALEDLDYYNESDEYGCNVAPNAQHIDEQDLTVEKKASGLFGCFDPGTHKTKFSIRSTRRYRNFSEIKS